MAEQIIQSIVESMKCGNCKGYLRPPIMYCSDNTNICGGCLEKISVNVVGRNNQLEVLGNPLEFPCRYKNFGCLVNVSWQEATKHENDCPFRQFSCPACDDKWTGNVSDMETHINASHAEMLFKQPTKFILQQSNVKWFVIHLQELYVMICNCDYDSGQLWLTLKSVGPLEYAMRRHFRITLALNKGVMYSERRQVEGGVNWEIDEATAIKIDISVLKAKLGVRNENVLELNIDVFSRIPLYNGSIDEGLQQEIECPVCQDYMTLPIYQCRTGHSFCGYCKPKLKSCPTCRGEMGGSRNFALESICGKMFYKCMYADDGCTFATLPKDIISHESTCDFGLYACPFKSFIKECEWRGKLDKISSHTLEEHGIKM